MNTEPVTVYAWRNEPQSDLRSLTAASLLGKIELAEGGDTRELFALYRDLLASDNQLQMEFENRKRAVEGDTSTLLPFDKSSPPDVEAKDICFPLLDSAPFYTAKTWLLNAVLYPVAVCEKVYAPAPGGYALAQIVPVPYQLLDYREGTLRIFNTDERGNALPTSHAPDPARYIVHRGHTLPLPDNWGGPMRAILFWILLRSMSRQWWADLLERFGMPFLKGKYSDEKGKTVLQRAFAIAQRLGGIVVHKNTEVEIVQAAAGDSSNSHERFIELCNKEISKLVAGQTLSSNAQPTGLGNGATPLQGAVRDDIRKSDCQRLAATLRTQLLAQFCQINAVPGRVPLLVFGSDSAAEMQALIGTVASLADAGLEPDDDGLAALSERVGFGLRRKAVPAASPGFPAAFHAVPLAAEPAAGKPREPSGSPDGEAPPSPDPLAEIVRTSRSSTECLRRLREALATRPLDEQAEELAAAMDSYAAKALLRPRRRSPDGEAPPSPTPLSVDANGAHHGDHTGRFVGKGGDDAPSPSSSSEGSAPATKDAGGDNPSVAETKMKDPHAPATAEEVKAFLADPPDDISVDKADALLAAGFDDHDGAGNTVKYGPLLLDHINRESHSEKDRIARKKRLGVAVKVIREATPVPSKNPAKPNERIYSGTRNGKAYIGVADEHGELNALVMVSYRRDRANDPE